MRNININRFFYFKFLNVVLPLLFVSCLLFAIFNSSLIALADDTTDDNSKTPMQIKQSQIDEVNAQIAATNNEIAALDACIVDASQHKSSTAEEKQNAEAKWNEVSAQINEERDSMEESAKNAYTVIFCKDVLDHAVGNDFLSNTLFFWPTIMPTVNNQEEELNQKVEYFYEQKHNYDEAINSEAIAQQKLDKYLSEKSVLLTKANDLNNQLAQKTAELAKIKELEEKLGIECATYISKHGYFAHPCPEGSISSPFGEERTRTKDDGTEEKYYHKGIDFSANMGTKIYAADSGEVISATHDSGYNGGRGMWVEIKHEDGVVTQYMHCSQVNVEVGQHVNKGDNIALVGSTGDSTGPHVHFQVELNNNPVDGTRYLEIAEPSKH